MLWVKNLEFGYSTWKRSREIAKAYGPERHLPKVKPKTVLVIFASCAAFAVLYFAIPSIINAGRFLQKMQLQAKEKNGSLKPVVSAKESKGQEASPTEKPVVQSSVASVSAPGPAPSSNIPVTDTFKTSIKNTMIFREMTYCLLANKATRTLYLLSKIDSSNTWKIEKGFSILVGRNNGQKITEGDKRTPEGHIFHHWPKRNRGTQCHIRTAGLRAELSQRG